MLSDIQIFSVGSLLVLRRRKDIEGRRLTGLLAEPPQMFVKVYDEELDETRFEPISWGVARTLAPNETRALGEYVARARSKECPPAAVKGVA